MAQPGHLAVVGGTQIPRQSLLKNTRMFRAAAFCGLVIFGLAMPERPSDSVLFWRRFATCRIVPVIKSRLLCSTEDAYLGASHEIYRGNKRYSCWVQCPCEPVVWGLFLMRRLLAVDGATTTEVRCNHAAAQ